MLDENIWMQLTDEDKFVEIQTCLEQLLAIEQGNHELCGTIEQGKLVAVKKELHEKIFKIIDLENAT
jgi:hypothetical protein